jgi:hypothetical protein
MLNADSCQRSPSRRRSASAASMSAAAVAGSRGAPAQAA